MNKNYLQKTLIMSGLALGLVIILLDGEITSPEFTSLSNSLNTSNVVKSLCFFIGGINILLGTVLLEYAVLYIPVIITFLFLDYGLILSCVKAIYEVIIASIYTILLLRLTHCFKL